MQPKALAVSKIPNTESCFKTVKTVLRLFFAFDIWRFDDDLIMSPCLRGGPNTKLRTVVWKLDSNWDD